MPKLMPTQPTPSIPTLADWWGAVKSVGQDVLSQAVAVPYDDEIARLKEMQKQLSSSRYRAESDLSQRIPKLRSAVPTPEGARIADGLSLGASKAISQGATASSQIDKTIARATTAREEMLKGAPSGATAALYAADKALAVNLKAKADSLYSAFFAALTDAEKKAASVSLTGELAKIPGAVYGDIAKAAGAAGKKAAEWGPTVAWIVGGAAVIYALAVLSPLIPRGRR